MPCRRSLIGLLSAMIALLCVPAIASAQAPGCTGTDPVPSGGPDVTAPNNTTATANPGWYTTPYTVTLHGNDAESGLFGLQWCLNNGAWSDGLDGQDVTIATSGVWTLNTRAVDYEGNVSAWRAETVQVDVNTPVDMTDAGGTGWHPAPHNVIVLAADMDSGLKQIWWQLDGGLAQSGPSGTSVPIAADGTHTLTTWAEDNAGNTSVHQDHTVRIDTVTPTDTTAAPGGWQTAALPVAITGADGHSGILSVTYQLDGGAPVTTTSGTVVNVSAEGDHVLSTRVRDNAGNESGWKTTNIHIDTTAPDNQTSLAGSGWRQGDYSVLVQGADSGSGVSDVQWRVNGGAIESGPPGLQALVNTNGDNIFETRVRDVAGNASAWRVEHVRIDKVLPTNTTTAPAPSNPNPYSVAVTGTDADAGINRVEWEIDGGPTQQGASGDTVQINGFGTHTLKTRVVDNAGNASAWRTDTVVISGTDTTRPTDTTVTAPAGWQAEPVTIDVTATDAGGAGVDAVMWRISQFNVPNSSQPIQTVSGDHASVTFEDEGRWLLETRVRDRAGNLSLQWRQHYINLDLTVPTDTTDIPATWQSSRSFSWSGTDALSGEETFEYMVDAGAPQTAAVGALVTMPTDGTFVIDHRVIDKAGQTSGWTTQTLKVDTVDPANTTAVPTSTWRPTALSLALTGTDDRSGLDKMQWRLNGGTITDGGPAVIDADGEYTLETRAVDVAGNDTAWRSDTVRVDVTNPVNDTPAAPTDWRSTDYAVHVAGSDGAGSGVAGVEVTIDGGLLSTDPDVTVTGDGEHTLETRIVDNVGHKSDPRVETIKIDSADPTASVTCPAGWNAHAVSCTTTADGGPSGIADLTASVDGGAFAVVTGNAVPVSTNGDHTVTLKAVDGAGNETTSAAAHVKIDRTLPHATLSCAAASTPTGYVCRAAGSDALSGLASLTYSPNGAAWRAVPAGGAISVAYGTIRVRALDVAGNQYLTSTVTLVQRKPPAPPVKPPTMRSSSVPVYLGGSTDDDSMIGAMLAARSANGTVSVDLRPLAVGRGTYKVTIVLSAGKAKRTVSKTYKVKRGDALRRISASLAGAADQATVALTVKKKHGRTWRKYASAKVVLAK
jgi:Bacterial Ig-like domain